MKISLVLGGGIALGAYHGGAFEALDAAGLRPEWIAASSVGAVNGAIIAGNPPERRATRLRQFWSALSEAPFGNPVWLDPLVPDRGPVRELHHLASALQTRMMGQPRSFVPDPLGQRGGLYDLSPLRRLIADHVDFGLVNSGPVRLNVMSIDIETGDPVVFDTARERIGVEHLLASCGFIGDFPAVEIDGRWLGDGGLVANTPVELILHEAGAEPSACFVLDLFSRRGPRPTSALAANERRSDLIFASQTWQAIRHYQEIFALRGALAEQRPEAERQQRPGTAATGVFVLNYRPDPEEAVMRGFDFSAKTLARRWQRGAEDMEHAVRHHAEFAARPVGAGLTVVEVL